MNQPTKTERRRLIHLLYCFTVPLLKHIGTDTVGRPLGIRRHHLHVIKREKRDNIFIILQFRTKI